LDARAIDAQETMKLQLILLIATLLVSSTANSIAEEKHGEQRFITSTIASQHLTTPPTVRIYLPASYHSSPDRRYPVLYLHDGQNVFSFAGTNIAFGWGSWELDKAADGLSRDKKIPEIIMVGIDNAGMQRYAEYCGAHHSSASGTNTLFENYSAFLINELKPKMDKEYRTKPDAEHTAVMGSSMGGICSLILAWEHPDVFGGAASLSGAFMVEKTNFLDHVLRPYTGKPKGFKVYLDSGSIDYTGGDDGRALTDAVAGELRRIGWSKGLLHFVDEKPLGENDLMASGLRKDKWKEAQTSQHNEFYWRMRVWRPLTFLFSGELTNDGQN
jgi:predicted alpha/beta superfamily hydrolase